jgi:hypothetical protein
MTDAPQKSVHVSSGPRGFPGLHGRITPAQLSAACELIKTGRATLEAALQMQVTTTHASIYRSREAGVKAAEKVEAGDELTEIEHAAFRFYACISAALAQRESILTRQALGDYVQVGISDTGQPVIASSKHSAQALEVLRLTCKHWRPVQEVEHSGSLDIGKLSPEELEARREALIAKAAGRVAG